jgi:Arc/MetJ family transcription regulator
MTRTNIDIDDALVAETMRRQAWVRSGRLSTSLSVDWSAMR